MLILFMLLNDVKIVLCRVAEPGNIGAACRAMKNMGLAELRLVNNDTHPLDLDQLQARAVHAQDIWENARIFNTLSEAVADCSIVAGTTRRRGGNRKNISMTPRDLALWFADHPGPASVVFGNERTGLEEEELDLCNVASHIPASDSQPSLNLSHAVQIYAYEFFLTLKKQDFVSGEWHAMKQAVIPALVAEITEELELLGFYRKPGREKQTRFLQDVISRAGLSEREGRYFRDIIVKAARMRS
ncbi:MAG: RNA methyltransferase [Treponema sp.]|nr:RNA methyltransferase [Treponema sp.]